MYTHELLGREKAEQLLREAARYRLARQAREAARAAGHDEGRRHARRAGRLIRRLRAAG
ncbi:hypothetical protein [Actinacidiphila glaucinigra]|uniref:hypothetical protein n=1 Tax=Actinacidiphila glaucinigra TaxID=235986 RepID=UPI003D94E441